MLIEKKILKDVRKRCFLVTDTIVENSYIHLFIDDMLGNKYYGSV